MGSLHESQTNMGPTRGSREDVTHLSFHGASVFFRLCGKLTLHGFVEPPND